MMIEGGNFHKSDLLQPTLFEIRLFLNKLNQEVAELVNKKIRHFHGRANSESEIY